MEKVLRIGLVGANADRSWAKDSHVPAVGRLPGLTVSAVATRSEASAKAAAAAFSADFWFTDAIALATSENVDVVTVCVKVPDHARIVLAALEAGKHVYCEWPLARDAAEAEMLAAAAVSAGRVCAIGLQGRYDPAAGAARELVTSGKIGRPLSARVMSTTAAFGPRWTSAYDYLNRAESGANLTTILGGHTIDLATYVLGNVMEMNAIAEIQFPCVLLTDTGAEIERNTPDQLFITSRHASGCVLSVEIGGYRPADTPFVFELTGSDGWLRLVGGDPRGFQAGTLTLHSSVDVEAPSRVIPLTGPAANVAQVYSALAQDILTGTRTVTDFGHATELTHLIDHVLETARSGVRWRAPAHNLR